MASYHLEARIIGRSAGQSAVAAAAYRSGDRLFHEEEQAVKDYSRKQGILFTGIFAPKGAPEWATDRNQLWNHVEEVEHRKNSQLARELTIALPHELELEQQRFALQDFIRDNFTRRGIVADVAIHAPNREGDDRNFHAHVMLTMREIEAGDFAATKCRDMNSNEALLGWRESWAKTANRHLERHGHAARIDHRSLQEQGIEREPTKKMGVAATSMERRGIDTERGDLNRAVAERNQERQAMVAAGREIVAPAPIIPSPEKGRYDHKAEVEKSALRPASEVVLEPEARKTAEPESAAVPATPPAIDQPRLTAIAQGVRMALDRFVNRAQHEFESVLGFLGDFFIGNPDGRGLGTSEPTWKEPEPQRDAAAERAASDEKHRAAEKEQHQHHEKEQTQAEAQEQQKAADLQRAQELMQAQERHFEHTRER